MASEQNASEQQHEYGASDITVLEGLEAVRKRPGMYIGSTTERGLHHLVYEVVDNSVDEALAGYASKIDVTIQADGAVRVEDDGRGIPVDEHPTEHKSTVEVVMTVLHAGGKFGGGGYKVSGGLHGVGASVVNALSTWLEVTIYRDGHIYYQKFENGGHSVEPLKIIGDCDINRTGSTVRFKADPEIFKETTVYNYATLAKRLQEIAFLNKGLRIILMDDREDNKKDEFLYQGGIIEFVKQLNKNKTPLHEDVIYVEGREDNILIEVAMQYNDGYNEALYSYTNNIHTHEGGTHEDGVKRALTRIINNYARNNKMLSEKADPLTGEDVREGLTMIISCKHPDPQFEGQTKTKLGNMEVRKIADDVFSNGFERYLMENPEIAKKIVEKSLTASRARMAAKKARELQRQTKGGLDLSNQWGKLTDCTSKNPSECEIFIVEGDSAGGSAIGGRNSKTQAVLPLRGKILNVEKARLDRALSNEEIRSMITAFGTGIGEDFDISKLRYDKIIIMTDADVDGDHIRILLLTLFYRFFRPLVESGHIYIAQPPLYKVSWGKNFHYVLTDAERDEFLKTLPANVKFDVARNKGLGEMDPEELCSTTMDINNRTLIQVKLDEAMEADGIFSLLMGEEVEPRRKFIEENAHFASNLDY